MIASDPTETFVCRCAQRISRSSGDYHVRCNFHMERATERLGFAQERPRRFAFGLPPVFFPITLWRIASEAKERV